MPGLFPNQLSHISGGTVTITTATPTGTGPLPLLIVPAVFHNNFLGRYKVYRGSGATILALIVGDGFSKSSTVYAMASAAVAQVPGPAVLVLGKRDVADVLWSVTLQAILDEVPNGEVPPFFAYKIESKDKLDIIDASQWGLNVQSSLENGPDFWHIAETADVAVLTAQDGNVIETVRNQSAGNLSENFMTSIAWSDLTRVQKPATLQTKKETFNVTPLSNIPLYMGWKVSNGPLQTLFFEGAQALVQGAGPFPANLEPGNKLDLEIDGFPFTAIFNATAATSLSGVAGPYAPAGGETFFVTFEGVETEITLLVTDTTAALIAANINAAVGDVVAANEGGSVRLTSTIRGLASSLQVTEGTGGNAILQFSTSLTKGTGNVDNIDLVTLTEGIGVIQESVQTAGVIFGATELNIQSASYGTGSTVEILNTSSANLLTEFGLVAGLTLGTGMAANLAAATASEVGTLFTGELIDVVHDSSTGRVISTTILKGDGTSIKLVSPQVLVLKLTPSAGDLIGFKLDNLAVLDVVSVDAATDALALKALFDADVTYTAIGTLEIGSDDSLYFVATDNGKHIFSNQSAAPASIASFTASTAYAALGYTDLSALGSGPAEGYIDIQLTSRYLSYDNPDLEHQQRPTDQVALNPGPPKIQHSNVSIPERDAIVNGDGNNLYGGWLLDPANESRTLGTQMVNKIKMQTFATAKLIKNAIVRESVNFLNVNAQAGLFLGVDEGTLDSVKGLYIAVLTQFVIGNHITPLKDPSDPTFNPERDSALIVPQFSQLNPVDIQNGLIKGIQFQLVAKSPLQGIFWNMNLVAATQPNLA